jgi:hypothetical protein
MFDKQHGAPPGLVQEAWQAGKMFEFVGGFSATIESGCR